jgi:hypothetical protein
LRHRKECSLIVLFVIEGAKGNNMCSPSSYTDLLEMSIEKPLNFDHSLLQNIELWFHSQNIRYLWVISQRSQWALWVISQRIYCFLGDILCKISRKKRVSLAPHIKQAERGGVRVIVRRVWPYAGGERRARRRQRSEQ